MFETVVGLLFEKKEVTYQGKKLEVYKAIEGVAALEYLDGIIYHILSGKYVGKTVEHIDKVKENLCIGVVMNINRAIGISKELNFLSLVNKLYSDLDKYYLIKDSYGVNRIEDSDLLEFLEKGDKEGIIAKLEKFGRVLNKKEYKVSPTIGREIELRNLLVSLCADEKMPLLVGESGVGKTAIVEELAFRIQTGQVPSFSRVLEFKI